MEPVRHLRLCFGFGDRIPLEVWGAPQRQTCGIVTEHRAAAIRGDHPAAEPAEKASPRQLSHSAPAIESFADPIEFQGGVAAIL